jgi:hypothetical protein
MARLSLAVMALMGDAAFSLHGGLLRPSPTKQVQMSAFFSAHHSLDTDKAEDWFAAMEYADLKTARKMQHEYGISMHNYLPAEDGSAVLCVWESKDPTCSPEQMQAFLDGPARLPGDALTTRVHKTLSFGVTPTSCWPSMPAPAAESSGNFFWVRHELHEDCAVPFWAEMIPRSPLFASPYPELLHSHYFLPTGPTEADPFFSVWETREPMSEDEFKAFINGPQSPVAGTCTNVVHRAMPGAVVPTAAFPARNFMGSMAMPLMDDMHRFMKSMMPPNPLTLEEEATARDAEERALTAEMNVVAAKAAGAMRLQHQIDSVLDDASEEQIAYGEWRAKVHSPLTEDVDQIAYGEWRVKVLDDEMSRKIQETLPLDLTPPAKVAAKGTTAEKSVSDVDNVGI